MRIDRLDLIAFGMFTDKTLNLADGDYGLHLIYGDNEAGKSTSLRALIAWLFGIPSRTTDNFLHSNPQLRIGGELRLSNGKEIGFVRRKASKDTLLKYGTNEVLDDTILASFLPEGIDENIFTRLWGIDHGRLVAGGKEILDQSGEIGQALFSAAVGTESLREILGTLQRDAEEIFKPRAPTKILNQAISNFKDAKKKIKELSLPVSEWKNLQNDLVNTLEAIKLVEKDIELKNKERSRFDRLKRVSGVLAERQSILRRIEEVGQVLILPEDFEEKRKTAFDKLQTTSEKKDIANVKLSNLKEETESLDIRNELLENEEAIQTLFKELGAVEKVIQDLPQVDGKRQLLRNDAEIILRGILPDVNLEQADGLRVLLNNKKWIFKLVQDHRLLSQRKERAESTLRDIKDEQESLKKRFGEQQPSEIDLKEIKATIATALKEGDVEQRLADQKKRVSAEKAICQYELSSIGRFKGPVESLLKLPMPVIETLDTFEKEGDTLYEKFKDIARKRKDIEEEKKQAEQNLKALLLTVDVPTLNDLDESRHLRNIGWNLIKHKYIDKIDVDKDILEFAHDSDLPTVYKQKIDIADHVADRLLLATDQVVNRANLEAKIANLESNLDDIAREAEELNEIQKIYGKRWNAIWEPLSIDTGTPREMKQWLLRVDKLRTGVMLVNTLAGEEQNLYEKCQKLRKAVSIQIIKFGESTDKPSIDLETMISLCAQRIGEEEGIRERKHQLEQSSKDIEIRLKRLSEELKSIESYRLNWQKEWGQAIAGLGLKPDVNPEYAIEIFERFESFFDKFDRAEDLRTRIHGMNLVVDKFNKRVFEFINSIGFKSDIQEATTIVAQLNRELYDAREARASLNKIQAQIKDLKEEVKNDDITIRTAHEHLTALMEQAGVHDVANLKIASEVSLNKRELVRKIDTLNQELNRNGDGFSIKELEKEFEISEIDAIDGNLEGIIYELSELHRRRDGLRDQRQTIQNEIQAKDGSSLAANESELAEEHLADIVSYAEQYIRLQIASLILGQQIEDYRKKNQAPLLTRAGELFSKLTLGHYTSLRDELDDNGNPILLGVRTNNKEVTVDKMSDGSRDQLYLALRLATLEQYLAQGEPMPFVVDDILIGFDDQRTKACLEVLAQLSNSTQVLLFTHHRRVLELADGIDTKAGIYIHELV